MKKALYFVALLFCLFPYTQVVPLASYTQPYALVFGMLASIAALPLVQEKFPRGDLTALVVLAIAGIFGFIVSCLPAPLPQDFKYLLIYISPVIFAMSAFAATLEAPRMTDRLIMFAAGAWIFTGLVQTIVDPSFMTQWVGEFSEAGEVVVASGRGTLGFAPEPTHFGFHMIVLAALLALVGGRNLMALACIATAVLVARSSSAVLALSLGAIVYLAIFGRWARWLLIAVVPAYFLLGGILDSGLLPSDLRVVQLLNTFYEDPWYLITADTSANMRLGGIWVGLQESFERGFIPAGLDSRQWEADVGPILARNPWLIALSPAGIASGLLIVIYQLGILGLGLVSYLTARMLRGLHSHFETLLLCITTFVFMSQYMISTPGYGLILGVLAARRVLAESANLGQRQAASLTPYGRPLAVP